MLNLLLKKFGFNGTPSTKHRAALAYSFHCAGRLDGGLVGHFIGLRHPWQQFKRHFAPDGPSKPAVDAISFDWPYFGGNFGPIQAQRKTPANCRRSLLARLFAFFDQHLVTRLA
jgi:hypothetical protein